MQAYLFNRCIQPLLRSQQFHGNFKCFKFNYSFLRWIFIIWLFIVFIIVNFLRMFDHFIVVQFISNKKILCIIWPSVFDHPVFYRSHISSVLTYRVVKKTITNIKYYTLVDIFSVKLWQMKLKFYTVFFSLILIFSGVYLFGLMKNCNSNPNLLQGCNLDISSRSVSSTFYIASRRWRDSGLASSGDRKRMHPGCY